MAIRHGLLVPRLNLESVSCWLSKGESIVNTRHALALSIVWLAAAGSAICAVHAVTPGNQSATVSVSLAMKSDKVRLGASPQVIFTLKNISPQDVSYPLPFPYIYHFHVVREGHGEPPLTMSHRHQRGIWLPGDTADLRGGGVTLLIKPGASRSMTFDLSNYYHLNEPGKYTVYGEYFDESLGKRLRTNTVTFEMIEANQ